METGKFRQGLCLLLLSIYHILSAYILAIDSQIGERHRPHCLSSTQSLGKMLKLYFRLFPNVFSLSDVDIILFPPSTVC